MDAMLSNAIMIDAWAELPPDISVDEFRARLEDLGNPTYEYDPDIGPRGAIRLGVFTEEQEG